MKIEIDISKDRRTFSISVNGEKPVPMENFLLLTKEGDRSRNFVYGAAENVGRLLYSLYLNSWGFEESGMRGILEVVAEDIRGVHDGRIAGSAKVARKVM